MTLPHVLDVQQLGSEEVPAAADTVVVPPPACCCATRACPVACPSHCPRFRDIPLFFGLNYTSKSALSSPDVAARLPMLQQDLANFLLIRGEYAWLGFGFLSCHNDTNCAI
eukprot:COSAG05_NODE_61_length_23137_cov_22.080693_4_plen_111_part_00